MDKKQYALDKHKEWKGKIEVVTRAPITNREELSVAYTPGVAEPCLAISKDVDLSYVYTRRANLVAVVTDGTAVLGLGDIGPEAGMPVMEGKCALFKTFGDVDAFPLCIRSKEVDDIVKTVQLLAGSFGGINLEDISAPRCFEIEKRLKEVCDIPVFHDDQHGTAVVTMAAMINALKLVGKKIEDVSVVVNGSGAAGIAITRLLMSRGLKKVILCDRKGAIYKGRDGLNPIKAEMAEISNLERKAGSLKDVIVGADVFIGVSAPGSVTAEMVKSMNRDPIIFAMANPTPEIMPDEALAAGESRRHRPQRLREPDKQRSRIPRHLPRCARRPRKRHQRRDEDRRSRGYSEHRQARGALPRVHHPRFVQPERQRRGRERGERGCTQNGRCKTVMV